MNVNIIFEWNKTDLGPTAVFCNFYEKIKVLRPDINFNYIDSPKMRHPGAGPNRKYGCLFMHIENPENGKSLLVSYYDILSEIFYYAPFTGIDLKRLRAIYSSIGVISDDNEILPIDYINYTPIGYMTAPRAEELVQKYYHLNLPKKIPQRLLFRGQMATPFRYHLLSDARFDAIDRSGPNLNVPLEEYIETLASEKINLSLNGHGELCHRDMEILGLGNVLLRPKLTSKFYEPLVPDVHYIGVEYDDLPGGQANHRALADRIFDKFNEIKDNTDFLDFVGKNARAWFERNGTIDANGEILVKVVDFNKLN